jgi:hypothetical protein
LAAWGTWLVTSLEVAGATERRRDALTRWGLRSAAVVILPGFLACEAVQGDPDRVRWLALADTLATTVFGMMLLLSVGRIAGRGLALGLVVASVSLACGALLVGGVTAIVLGYSPNPGMWGFRSFDSYAHEALLLALPKVQALFYGLCSAFAAAFAAWLVALRRQGRRDRAERAAASP